MKGEDFVIDAITAEILAKKYYKSVYSFCYSNLFCDEYGASEVTQEVFLFFQEKREELESVNILAWLYSVAKNKMSEYIRANEKYEKMFVELNEKIASVSDEEIFAYIENNVAVDDDIIEKQKEFILKSLSERDRELYKKIYVEKKTYKQIGEELNTPEKTVNSRSARLKLKIAKLISFTFTFAGQIIIKLMF